MPQKKFPKKIILVLALVSAGTLGGFLLGKHNSPDASKPETARIFLAMYGKWKNLGNNRGKITLRAGTRTYEYATGDTSVTVKYLSVVEMANEPMPAADWDSDFEKLVALSVGPPAETGLFVALFSKVGEGVELLTRGERVMLSVLTVGGGVAGYLLAYRAQPDYENKVFEDTLGKEVDLWGRYENEWRQIFSLGVTLQLIEDTDKLLAEIEGRSSPETAEGVKEKRNKDKKEQETAAYLKKVYALHPEIESEVSREVNR